jgi:hypothetical protein
MDHAAFAELTAGRALGDLDVAEQQAVDAHLRQCASCRALTRDLDAVLTDLAFAAPRRAVPASLGPSIMAAIRSESAGMRPMAMPSMGATAGPAVAPRPSSRQDSVLPEVIRPDRFRGWGRALGIGLAAAAALAIVVLGAEVLSLRDQVDSANMIARGYADQLSARDTAMQVVADPSHASAWLAPSTGDVTASALMVWVPGSTQTYLVASGLPATADGQDYQFWYADDAGVHAGITFDYDGSGMLIMPVEVDLSGAKAAMLTIEEDGGAQGGPSKDIVFGELPAS